MIHDNEVVQLYLGQMIWLPFHGLYDVLRGRKRGLIHLKGAVECPHEGFKVGLVEGLQDETCKKLQVFTLCLVAGILFLLVEAVLKPQKVWVDDLPGFDSVTAVFAAEKG